MARKTGIWLSTFLIRILLGIYTCNLNKFIMKSLMDKLGRPGSPKTR